MIRHSLTSEAHDEVTMVQGFCDVSKFRTLLMQENHRNASSLDLYAHASICVLIVTKEVA